MTNVVEMKHIEKSFVHNRVLKDVDFSIAPGSIHALLGENGTGKTTLMNILTGLLPKDSGEIDINGQPATAESMKQIAFIHQELSLVNDLTVYENLFLGRELKRHGLLQQKKMIQETQDFLDKVGIKLNPTEMVRDLNASYKQITEIVRSLMHNAKVIIMDEPTTSLTDVEIEEIFEIMRMLKKQGVSIIFISHKLNEVLEICDSYTVMRDGVVVATGAVTPKLTELALTRQMVGKELADNTIYRTRKVGETVLEIKNFSKEREYKNVNLNVKKGEIVGVTGLLGDGRSEVFSTVIGADKPDSGELFINGKKAHIRTTSDIRKYGLAYLPRNRKENGIIKDLDIEENLTLPMMDKVSQFGLIDKTKMTQTVNKYIKQINIKVADPKELIGSLSGGNQQKVLLAKALNMEPKVMILDNPTQGVDVGAKAEIYHQIMDLADQGISFVILSSEIPEIQKLCDRVYIMFHGEIKQELPHNAINEEDVMLVATGGKLGGE